VKDNSRRVDDDDDDDDGGALIILLVLVLVLVLVLLLQSARTEKISNKSQNLSFGARQRVSMG